MLIPAFIRNIPIRLVVYGAIILLAGIAVWTYGQLQYERGSAEVEERYQKAHTKAALKRAEEIAELMKIHTERLNKQRREYEDEIADINRRHVADASYGLRLPRSICAESAGEAKAGGDKEAGATAGTVVLPKRVTEDLRRLAKRADEVTAGCRQDEKFIDENGFREK